MIEIEIDKLIKKAKELHKQKKKWHIHMLMPKCVFNTNNLHAFVLEDTTDNKTYVYYSKKRMLKQGKEVARLMYNFDSNDHKASSKLLNEKIRIMIKKAETYNKKNIAWHHHMLFPECVFNKHKGNWCLVFEDPLDDTLIEATSKKEPREGQEILEKLFYSQKK